MKKYKVGDIIELDLSKFKYLIIPKDTLGLVLCSIRIFIVATIGVKTRTGRSSNKLINVTTDDIKRKIN